MTLTALLVCVDEAAAKVLRQVLEELSIRVESCPDFARAAMRLAQERFDVAIVDGESNAEVISLLQHTRDSRRKDSTLAVVVVAGQESIREMFSMGVNFVLYKPVAYDRAMSSLRAARAVMRKDKRKNPRAAVHAHATMEYASVQQEKATLVDLAQDGMQVQLGKKLPPTSKVYFTFKLPQQSTSVRLSGQVVWQDWNGRAGVQFVDVPKASRKLMTDYLGANLPTESKRDELPEITVEMEEPLQLATVSVAEQTHGSKAQRDKIQEAFAPKAAAITQTDVDNRRNQTRYACRLGAEVCQIGSKVPVHCCLTDLSSGGCYLEVSMPIPSGSTVELVVRTHEMGKLRLRGLVQASHPGYGMGIAFDSKGRQEQESVKKLIQFVATTTDPS